MSTQNTDNDIGPRARSPIATIDNLMARFRWSVRHHGASLGNLALDALQGVLTALRELLRANQTEANAVESGAVELVAKVHEITADGVVDAVELRGLERNCQSLVTLTRTHAAHAAHLNA
jgi:hypothetical protein